MKLQKQHKYPNTRNRKFYRYDRGWRIADNGNNRAWCQILHGLATTGKVLHPLKGYSDIPF